MRAEELPSDNELLDRYARLTATGEWVFKQRRDDAYPRGREDMLELIKLNVLMDREPTDIATTGLMYEIVRRLVALEDAPRKRKANGV